MNPSSPWQQWLLHYWCVLPLQCSKPSSLSNQYAVSNARLHQGVAVCLVSRFQVCARVCVCWIQKCLLVNQMRALTNHMSTPPQNHDPCLLKSCSCHFAPTCTSLTLLQNLILRVAGKSKILGSVSRSSQGLPRTFRDAAETIRKSRASLCVSVIKLGRKLECMCAVFFLIPSSSGLLFPHNRIYWNPK